MKYEKSFSTKISKCWKKSQGNRTSSFNGLGDKKKPCLTGKLTLAFNFFLIIIIFFIKMIKKSFKIRKFSDRFARNFKIQFFFQKGLILQFFVCKKNGKSENQGRSGP